MKTKTDLGRAILAAEAAERTAEDAATAEQHAAEAIRLRGEFVALTGIPFRAAQVTESGIFLVRTTGGQLVTVPPRDVPPPSDEERLQGV